MINLDLTLISLNWWPQVVFELLRMKKQINPRDSNHSISNHLFAIYSKVQHNGNHGVSHFSQKPAQNCFQISYDVSKILKWLFTQRLMHPDKRISIMTRANLSATTSHLSPSGAFWHAAVQRMMDSLCVHGSSLLIGPSVVQALVSMETTHQVSTEGRACIPYGAYLKQDLL